MIRRHERHARRATAVTLVMAAALAACGDDAGSTTSGATTTVAPATTAQDDLAAWRAEATSLCDRTISELGAIARPADDDDLGFGAFVAEHRRAREALALNVAPEPPPGAGIGAEPFAARIAAAEDSLVVAEAALAAGDIAAARAAMESYWPQLLSVGALYALAGAACGTADPARAAAASLNVPLDFVPLILTAGFDSLWITEDRGHRVARVDATTGEVLAMIEVGEGPIKLQPADGRMWGRTSDAIFAIDPATNTVAVTVPKADVGSEANRAWAVDGSLWICDGERLHRYDPTTVTPVAVMQLGVPCGMPGGTEDLIVASSFNDFEGESGSSSSAFVDPATNTVLATVHLPVDVGIGIVLDDAVFFPGQYGARAVVVDRATWTVAATPDLGRPTFIGTAETDGRHVYLSTADRRDVLVVDASTFAVTDTIETLGTHAVALSDGSLWVTDPESGLAQRFDLEG